MAYPFCEAPKVIDFINQAKDHFGCECRHKDGIVGPRGEVVMSYLVREHEGRKFVTEPLPIESDERLAPDTLRRLCAQLDIPTSHFGFNLE